MVALLHPNSETSAKRPQHLRLVVDNTASESGSGSESEYWLGGLLSGALPSVDRSLVRTVVLLAIAIFGSIFAVRTIQGTPGPAVPSTSEQVQTLSGQVMVGTEAAEAGLVVSEGVGLVGTPMAGPGDEVIVAKPGDSMWSIAVALSPDSDPRSAVTALIDANGGDSIRIGQQIVIPEQLLD